MAKSSVPMTYRTGGESHGVPNWSMQKDYWIDTPGNFAWMHAF